LNLLVDTSVWSLALRRDQPADLPEVRALGQALGNGEVCSTGLILQELLQGFNRPQASQTIIRYFGAIPLLVPDRSDYEGAADLHNLCRRKGVQTGTIDALLAHLCIRHELMMLTTDKDFQQISKVAILQLWSG
jgi:predicted nucleic acid-binding protein